MSTLQQVFKRHPGFNKDEIKDLQKSLRDKLRTGKDPAELTQDESAVLILELIEKIDISTGLIPPGFIHRYKRLLNK